MEWHKGTKVLNSLQLASQTSRRVEIDAAYELTFHGVKANDTGLYSCYVNFVLANQYELYGKDLTLTSTNSMVRT